MQATRSDSPDAAGPDHPDVMTFSLPTESFTCADCGRTVVPTSDHLPDLRIEHRCPPQASHASGPGV